MKKIFILAASMLACLSAWSQIAEVSPATPLLRGVESSVYYPELSSDGSKIFFTDADYKNPRVYDYTDNVTTRIDAPNVARTRASLQGNSKVTASVEGSVLNICVDGVTRSFTPVESFAGYCWPSVSPDGKKVMFVAAGKGIVVTDLQGNIISRPGTSRMEAPVWFGNNHIVAMNATDDGHQISSSQIVLITLDGSQTQALTRPESMSMFPSACGTASKVVYNTIDGRLYQLIVKLK